MATTIKNFEKDDLYLLVVILLCIIYYYYRYIISVIIIRSYFIILYCIIWHYIILHILYSTTLYYIKLYYTTLYYITLYINYYNRSFLQPTFLKHFTNTIETLFLNWTSCTPHNLHTSKYNSQFFFHIDTSNGHNLYRRSHLFLSAHYLGVFQRIVFGGFGLELPGRICLRNFFSTEILIAICNKKKTMDHENPQAS